MSDFSNRIDQLLLERHLRRADLSRGADIPESSLRGWREGKMPSIEAALKVANFFSVSVAWLITGEGEGSNISADEFELLELFRSFDDRDKNTVLTVARGLSAQYSAEARPASSISG